MVKAMSLSTLSSTHRNILTLSYLFSYDVAPCELFFARFKSDDINPRHVATSKAHFDKVVRLVLDRCRKIPRSQIIMFFHHCMQNVFRYLVFERL